MLQIIYSSKTFNDIYDGDVDENFFSVFNKIKSSFSWDQNICPTPNFHYIHMEYKENGNEQITYE